MNTKRDFPENFLWGTATASYQVEGGAFEEGKGPSVWTEFEKRPGAICENVTGDVTSNQFHCYKEDVKFMKDAGMKVYRFSLAWSRVFPNGYGKPNPQGLDYYNRLIDELLANDIQPWVTLYHWDLPLALQKEFGGWESRETVKYFGEYADYVARNFGTKVKNYFTTNEFLGCTDQGYAKGVIAPGLKVGDKRRNQVRHNMLVAHGTALQALRSAAPHAKAGIAENPWLYMPIIDTPEHVDAAKLAFRETNAHFITAIMEGKYLDSYLEEQKENAPVVQDGDFKLISAPMDFLGLNIYYGKYVSADPTGETKYRIHSEYSDDQAILFQPSSMYWTLRMVQEMWPQQEIYISENGTGGYNERVNFEGSELLDIYRIKYLDSYLASLARAMAEGVPVKGYFHWSLLDNLEWCSGFRPKFGLINVNYNTSERLPKASYHYYKNVIKTGRVQ